MDTNILNYLDQTENLYPKKVAFCDSEGGKITFCDLKREVEQIGSYITNRVLCTNCPIVVLTERNIRSVSSFLGAVYSGNFYIPVDASLPETRINEMLAAASPVLIINCSDRKFESLNGDVVDYFEIFRNDIKLVERKEVTNLSPLYGIFTSGSTGLPKLVVKNHLSLISFIEQYVELFGFNADDVQGNQIPFYFDASTKDLFTTIKTGCTTNIIAKGLFSQPGKLAQYLIDNAITSICWVPSALSMFNVFAKIKPEQIKRVLFVGEPMPAKQLNVWIKALPNARYINLYGSTENAGNCLFYEINGEVDESKRIPIGKPFPNVKVFLLDEDNRLILPSQTDISGEICVSGDIVALGYYADPELTARKFIQNPINRVYHEQIFKTGDVGKYDQDGNIVCLCRQDYQIKLNGCRIELGDIEVAAISLADVNSACCIFDEERKRIVLFYASGEDVKEKLITHLKSKLPAYMLPAKYIYLPQLPLNANGKIHRTKLKEMYDTNQVK